jgi:hypothetical protein
MNTGILLLYIVIFRQYLVLLKVLKLLHEQILNVFHDLHLIMLLNMDVKRSPLYTRLTFSKYIIIWILCKFWIISIYLYRKLGDGLFLKVCEAMAASEYSQLQFESMIVDNASMQVLHILQLCMVLVKRATSGGLGW